MTILFHEQDNARPGSAACWWPIAPGIPAQFAELPRVRPELRDVVRKLAEDHQMIAVILSTVGDLAYEVAGARPERRELIRRELAGLAAIMESHFGYEERAISDAIDDQVQDSGRESGTAPWLYAPLRSR